jgi:hypothetical protein
MDFTLRVPEIVLGDFMVPWGMVIAAAGYLLALVTVIALERFRLTRFVWNLPIFFVALAVLFGCVLGLVFTP